MAATVEATLELGINCTGVGIDENLSRAVVCNVNSHNVSVIDTTDNSILATIAPGLGPRHAGCNETTGMCYIRHPTRSASRSTIRQSLPLTATT